MINGPISKKILKNKFLGITEYLAKMNKTKNFAMLIYNKNLAVSPLTTHVAIKNFWSNYKKKIINNVFLINKFYASSLKKKINIGITGLNPHCESNFKDSEENVISPAIKFLKKTNIK